MKKTIRVLMMMVMFVMMFPMAVAAEVKEVGYSDAELCSMVKVFCVKNNRWVSQHYEVDQCEGENVIIRAFDVMVDEHDDGTSSRRMVTKDQFTINRKTGVGTDAAGKEVKLMQNSALKMETPKAGNSLQGLVRKLWQMMSSVKIDQKVEQEVDAKEIYAAMMQKLVAENADVRDIHELYCDLDDDGQEELLVSYVYDDTSYCVLDIYTIRNGEVATLLQADFFLDVGGRKAEFGMAEKDGTVYVCLHEENVAVDWMEEVRFGSYRLFDVADNGIHEVQRLEYRDEFMYTSEGSLLQKERCSTFLNGEKMNYQESRAWRDAIVWTTKATL